MTYTPDPFSGVMVAGSVQRTFRELNDFPLQDNGYRVRVGDEAIKAGPRCLEVAASGYYRGNCNIEAAIVTVEFYAQTAGKKIALEPVGKATYEDDRRLDLAWKKQICRVVEAEAWIPAVEEWMNSPTRVGRPARAASSSKTDASHRHVSKPIKTNTNG